MQQDEEFLQLIFSLLVSSKLPDEELVNEVISENPQFEKLYTHILAIREMSFALGKGDLAKLVSEKGFILSNMKALQANLRHLTWQTQKIADGDYSQRVDFLGDFSDAFNQMTEKLKGAASQLIDLAHLDTLTKIPNRLSLEEFFKKEFAIAKQQKNDLCVFLFDIDFFKSVNDTYGHAAGDQVLIQVAEILSKQFRSTDILARYGGEEFVAVLPDIKLTHALMIGERALNSIENADFIIDENGKKIKITVSIGLSSIRPDEQSYEDIIKRSDDALYEAKHSGRNCMRVLS